MTVTVSKATVYENIFKNFYDLVSAITGFSTIVYPTFPDDVKDAAGDYPIVVIDSADVSWDTFTFGKNLLEGTISINIYTTTAKDTDVKASAVNNAIELGKTTLCSAGLRQVNLESTTSDMAPHGKIKVFMKTLTFAYKFTSDKTFAF